MKTNFVSTRTLWTQPRNDISRMESDLATATQEASNGGRYADIGLHLAYRTGTGIDLHHSVDEFAAQKERNGLTSLRLSSSYAILDQLRKDGESFLNLVVPGKLAEISSTTIVQEAQTKLQALISQLNETAGGQYLFGGINSQNKPIVDYTSTPTSPSKAAVDAAFKATFNFAQGTQPDSASITGAQMKTFLDGPFAALFADPQWATTWSKASDRNIRSAIGFGKTIETSVNANAEPLRQLAMAYTIGADLGLASLSNDAKSAINDKIRDLLGYATYGVTQIQSGIGRAQSAVTDVSNQIDAQMTILTRNLNDLEVSDESALSVRINQLQTQIQIAYSLTGQLKNLSLVKYI